MIAQSSVYRLWELLDGYRTRYNMISPGPNTDFRRGTLASLVILEKWYAGVPQTAQDCTRIQEYMNAALQNAPTDTVPDCIDQIDYIGSMV